LVIGHLVIEHLEQSMHGRYWIGLGAVLAGVAVALGAIGAHLLKAKLSADQLANFDTAARYHMIHAVGLILLGLALRGQGPCRILNAAGWLLLAGIVLFSGGLYGLVLTEIKPLVHIVPIGGISWIVAWLLFAWGALAASKK
jgi:uncharacterized membrane protein YgdD (TMEM256/DUF423 family)